MLLDVPQNVPAVCDFRRSTFAMIRLEQASTHAPRRRRRQGRRSRGAVGIALPSAIVRFNCICSDLELPPVGRQRFDDLGVRRVAGLDRGGASTRLRRARVLNGPDDAGGLLRLRSQPEHTLRAL